MRDLLGVRPRPAEIAAVLPGDDLVGAPDVVMDQAFDVPLAAGLRERLA